MEKDIYTRRCIEQLQEQKEIENKRKLDKVSLRKQYEQDWKTVMRLKQLNQIVETESQVLGDNIVNFNVLENKKKGELDDTFFWKKQPAVSTRKNEASLDFIISNHSQEFEKSMMHSTFIDPKNVSLMHQQLLQQSMSEDNMNIQQQAYTPNNVVQPQPINQDRLIQIKHTTQPIELTQQPIQYIKSTEPGDTIDGP